MIQQYEDIKQELTEHVIPFIPQGLGSSVLSKKTYLFGLLIKEFNLQSTLDVGVYYGGSLFPQAYAHKKYSQGKVYGVDPYTKENFTQYAKFLPLESLNKYIEETNFDDIYNSVQNSIKELEFENTIHFIREPSRTAINYFIKNDIYFDLIHIDGNHDAENVMSDVKLYLPRLKDNGFFIVDDAMFPTVKPACAYVKEHIPELYGNLFFTIFQKSETINEQIKNLLEAII